MSLLSRTCLALALGLSLLVLSTVQVGDARAQKDDKFDKKSVTFNSVDGVELKGTYWTSKGGKPKNACVLLLHNFSKQKGGTSHDDGWDSLAEALAEDGYNVLSFDFRGHGDSKSVGKQFWDTQRFPHNAALLKRGPVRELPTTLDAKDFQAVGVQAYYPHMVDDIAAAKAFLDNKAGGSAANLIVIGAGEGAALGAMWMTSEFHRFRDKSEGPVIPMVRMNPNLDTEPEGKDLVCGIWLTISSTVEGRAIPLDTWVNEVGGKKYHVPMLFMYGQNDDNGKKRAAQVLGRLMGPNYRLMGSEQGENPLNPLVKYTRDWAVKDTKLEGSQLLQGSLDTNAIIKGYIKHVLEDRGSKENKRHDQEKYRFFWVFMNSMVPAKNAGEELMMPIDPKRLGILR
jgi:Alpha/beta hydrolase family